MKRFVKNKKGITLIALIITIIVMLILVAVTINVALNGGIFDKATDAKNKTNLAKEKEILQTTALGYLQKSNGYVDLEAFANAYAYAENGLEGYTLTKEAGKDYVTASNGTNTFYITKQGGITDQKPQSTEVTYLNYNDNPLPKFKLNPNPSELFENEALSTIVSGEEDKDGDWSSECSATFDMYNETKSSYIQGEYSITQDGVYYIRVNIETEEDEYEYIFSPEDITVSSEGQVDIPGGAWYRLVNYGDNENYDIRADAVSIYPVLEGIIIENTTDEKDDVELPYLTNANTYYQHLFVVVED